MSESISRLSFTPNQYHYMRADDDVRLMKHAAELVLRQLAGDVDNETSEEILSDMRSRSTVVAVDRVSEAIVGAGSFTRVSDDHHHIDTLVTSPDVRGRGVGSGIVGYMEQTASEEGAGTMTVYPTIDAEGFYNALGYEEIEDNFIKTLDTGERLDDTA